MSKKRKYLPLSASITIGCSLFMVALTGTVAAVSFNVSRSVLYERYQEQMTSIVNIAEAYVDKNDMYECTRTLVESEKYVETQKFFDKFVTNYTDLHYLYILSVLPPDDPCGVMAVCSASTDWEKENEPEGVLHLGDKDEEWYPDSIVEKLRQINEGDKDVFFFEDSTWVSDYTLARPLIDSDGNHFALLCVDISTEVINADIQNIVVTLILPILGASLLFFIALMLWLYLSVVNPIRRLQNSVFEFASGSHDKHNPDELVFNAPKIYASREVQNLSASVEKMSLDMKDYVVGIMKKEEEVKDLDVVAHSDALTGLLNKAAYDRDTLELNKKIKDGNSAFAIVMVDVNSLKEINDHFGHENGDKYIVGACEIIKSVYTKSPIYRVGGDEIIVILTGEDYENRNALLKKAKSKFAASSQNDKVEEFDRYSAAIGMGVYSKEEDQDSYSVFRRADKEMYKNKAEIKADK